MIITLPNLVSPPRILSPIIESSLPLQIPLSLAQVDLAQVQELLKELSAPAPTHILPHFEW